MKSLSIILVLYIVAFSFLSIRNHELYQTFGWDLGFFDQLLWQASRGNLNLVSTIGDINLVGDHFQPILYLPAPLYWLWDDVRVILVAQTVIIASAAIPLYLLAREKLDGVIARTPSDSRGGRGNLNSRGIATAAKGGLAMTAAQSLLPLLISISYLLFHGTQFTLTNEFHQSAFIPLFLSWGLYFLEMGDGVTLGIISLLLLLLVREETALLIMGIGLMYVVRAVIPRLTRNLYRFNRFPIRSEMTKETAASDTLRLGAFLVISGLLSFFLLVSLVIPKVSSQGRYIHFGYGELGSTPTEVLSNSIKDPIRTTQLLVSPKEKLIQVRNALLAFGGLPLLSPPSLIPIAIHYAVRFIDTRNVHRWLDINHYAAPLGPLLAFATIQALSNVRRVTNNVRRATSYVLPMLGIGIIGTNLLVHAPIFALTKSQLYFIPQWVKDANKLVASVPKDAAVAANNSLFPHLSHRDKIYLLPDIRDADYIAVDLSDGPNKYAPWGYEKMSKFADELMGNGEWKVEKWFGRAILLKKV